jgi:hypothetical protein
LCVEWLLVLRYFRIRYWNKSGKSRMSKGG